MSLDKRLLYTTTPITTVSAVGINNASGFFYQILGDIPEGQIAENYWLVTNRHVVYNTDASKREILVDSLVFKVRYDDKKTGTIQWIDVRLDKAELRKKTKVHTDDKIDVAVIDIYEAFTKATNIIAKENKENTVYINPITEKQLPDQSKFPIEVCDDTVCIGYPRGFYDASNLYPVTKSGIIASEWGANFSGDPRFLIDLQLFPGSSGSLVITKPRREDLNDEGFLIWKQSTVFSFLGIYSGEPVTYRIVRQPDGTEKTIELTYNFGNVWYAWLVPEIIDHGSPVK